MLAWLMRWIQARGLVPAISPTERAALEAGTVWIEPEIFSGRPDARRILAQPYPDLSPRERAFLEGPLAELCAMIDEGEIQRTREVPGSIMECLRRHRFLGLAIPEAYGGHGFGALLLSTVFGVLATRSRAVCALVMIPNTVGPGELLLHHGTPRQRDHYLPRLAHGLEIPCFALTELEAGSDAAALRSRGVAFRGPDGRVLLRLTWKKRYITLAPIATLVGLAFQLEDPDDLLGRGPRPGITCALVPASLEGVRTGDRHDPLGLSFHNGPTEGDGVEVGLEQVIGEEAGIGQGWRMLMEALSGGRALSLPAQSVAAVEWVTRVAGAYSAVRRQFGVSIGRFEGVAEALARIGGLTYLSEAARVFTCGALDSGHRPPVVSAIVKYNLTEIARSVACDGMDVLGGAGICRGPRNLIADAYIGAPVGITVEGANILTRTLIVFGQGAIRCHPHAAREARALLEGDGGALVRAVAGHALSLVAKAIVWLVMELTRGLVARVPQAGAATGHLCTLAWASARFAVLVDLALVLAGSRLKQREALAGRFADALSWIYLAFAAIRRFGAEGHRSQDVPLLDWSIRYALVRVQSATEGIVENLEVPWLVRPLAATMGFLFRVNRLSGPPADSLGASVAAIVQRPGEQRDRLTAGVGIWLEPVEPLARLEAALDLAVRAAPIHARITRAAREGRLPGGRAEDLAGLAASAGLITVEEAALLEEAQVARLEALQVDVFARGELGAGRAPRLERAPALSPAGVSR